MAKNMRHDKPGNGLWNYAFHPPKNKPKSAPIPEPVSR